MKPQKNNIARNLTTLRQLNKYSQEDVAEQIGVSRQAVAKWEAGQSVPRWQNCMMWSLRPSSIMTRNKSASIFRPEASTYLAQFVWVNAAKSYFPNRPEMYSK